MRGDTENQGGFTRSDWMIAIAILAIMVAIAIPAFTGYGKRDVHRKGQSLVQQRGYLTIYTDPDTGCQYVGNSDRPVPRMGANGQQICNPIGQR